MKITPKTYKAKKPNRVVAEEEIIDMPEEEFVEEPTELLFEGSEVADLLAQVTGEEVEMESDEDKVVFRIGEDEYTVEPEGDEEILEARRVPKSKRPVKASTRKPMQRRQQPAKSNKTRRN